MTRGVSGLRYHDDAVPWVVLVGEQPEPGKRYMLFTAEALEIAKAATEALQRTAARRTK